MNFGHFMISAIFGFALQSNFNFSKYMTKLNIAALVGLYLLDYVYIKSRLLETPLTSPILNAWIGGTVKHRHGIFLPLLIHEFIFKRRHIFEIVVSLLYKLFLASSLTYAFWRIFYICNSKFIWIELHFSNTVSQLKNQFFLFQFLFLQAILITIVFFAMQQFTWYSFEKIFPGDCVQPFYQSSLLIFKSNGKLLRNHCAKFLRIAEKLFASSFLCNGLIMKIFLFRRDSLLEINFENMVRLEILFALNHL